MGEMTPVYVLNGSGTFESNEAPRIVDKMIALGIRDTLALVLISDKNRATAFHSQKLPVSDDQQLIINPADIRDFSGYHADALRAAERAGEAESINRKFANAHIAKAGEFNLDTSCCVFSMSWTSGHHQEGEDTIEQVSTRLPHEVRLLNVPIPHEYHLREAVALDPYFPKELAEKGNPKTGKKLITASLVTDNLSPIVRQFGRTYQDDLRAWAIAASMAAPYHFANQRSIADMAVALAKYEKCISIAVGVKELTVVKGIWWYDWMTKLWKLQKKGRVNIKDTIIQVQQACKQAIEDPNWRMIADAPSSQKPAFLYIVLPFEFQDKQPWSGIVPGVERWLTNHYSWVIPQWLSCTTPPQPNLASSSAYWLNCFLFYPVPHHNLVIQQILSNRTGKVSVDGEVGKESLKKGLITPTT